MRENLLTTKEATLIGDLLNYEQMACKKAGLYARTLTNVKLAQKFNEIKENHKKRFDTLLMVLKGE